MAAAVSGHSTCHICLVILKRWLTQCDPVNVVTLRVSHARSFLCMEPLAFCLQSGRNSGRASLLLPGFRCGDISSIVSRLYCNMPWISGLFAPPKTPTTHGIYDVNCFTSVSLQTPGMVDSVSSISFCHYHPHPGAARRIPCSSALIKLTFPLLITTQASSTDDAFIIPVIRFC
jgi:hypothetical protein